MCGSIPLLPQYVFRVWCLIKEWMHLQHKDNWRRLHNEEHHNLNIIRDFKARRMILEEHIARMGDTRNAYNILVGKPEGRDNLEELGVDGKITLVKILRK
jgi:hypothetical protein